MANIRRLDRDTYEKMRDMALKMGADPRSIASLRDMMEKGELATIDQAIAGKWPTDPVRIDRNAFMNEPKSVRGIDPREMQRMEQAISQVNREKSQIQSNLDEALTTIKEFEAMVKRLESEPLILYKIDRVSKDGKFCYVKKQDTDLRIESVKDLEAGDEVLLHPKTYQIVERIGKPPLEFSRFSPDTIPNVKWDDIGGLEEAKADMIEAIEMPHKHKDLFKFYGKKQIKGILLSGPPGCGKTMLGKAAAKSLATIYDKESSRTGFLYVKGPEILNQYVGATEQTIRDMFDDARRHKEEHGYPAIIFLDEADAILAARGTRNVGIGNTIVPQFLTEMDGLEESSAIVIIATNRPDVLDPAIVRDGRIDRKVAVTRPTLDSATDILMLNLKGVPLSAGVMLEDLAQETAAILYHDDCKITPEKRARDAMNGAMLANCVNLAVSSALRRDLANDVKKKGSGVSLDDMKAAIRRVVTQSANIRHDLEVEAA